MRIFVYGTLKQHGRLHYILQQLGAEFLGYAVTTHTDFAMLRYSGSFPALVKCPDGAGTKIYGEAYDIPEDAIHVIDRVEGYPTMYNREPTSIFYMTGKKTIHTEAIVYFMEHGKFTDEAIEAMLIESGEWTFGGVEDDSLWSQVEGRDEMEVWPDDNNLEVCEDSQEFIIERGFYIATDYAELDGPHETLQDAIAHVEAQSDYFSSCAWINIGFRMVRTNLTDDELAALDYQCVQ